MKDETSALIDSFSEPRKRCLQRKIDFQCSGWLSVIPVAGNHFDMSPNEFRDAIALRYGCIPIDLLTHCDADGEVFSVNHALNCSKGGLVYGRHNELRDLNCSLLDNGNANTNAQQKWNSYKYFLFTVFWTIELI